MDLEHKPLQLQREGGTSPSFHGKSEHQVQQPICCKTIAIQVHAAPGLYLQTCILPVLPCKQTILSWARLLQAFSHLSQGSQILHACKQLLISLIDWLALLNALSVELYMHAM